MAGYRCTYGIAIDGRLYACGDIDDSLDGLEGYSTVSHIVCAAGGKTMALLSNGLVTWLEEDATDSSTRESLDHLYSVRSLSASPNYTAVLHKNGTVTVVSSISGIRRYDEPVSRWTDIAAVAAGRYHLLGLGNDGRMHSLMMHPDRKTDHGQCDVSRWDGHIMQPHDIKDGK
jgi:alpha-tubulin suppressor-like RCC1 family protein